MPFSEVIVVLLPEHFGKFCGYWHKQKLEEALYSPN